MYLRLLFAFVILATVLTGRGIAFAQSRVCTGTLPEVHINTKSTPPIRQGLVFTNDDSVQVSVVGGSDRYTHWSVNESVSGVQPREIGAFDSDRIDVTKNNLASVNLISKDGASCTLPALRLTMLHAAPKDLVFVLPSLKSESLPLPDIQLPGLLSVTDPYAIEGEKDLRIHGRLAIGSVKATGQADVVINSAGFSIDAKDLRFDLLPPNVKGSLPFEFSLEKLDCKVGETCDLQGHLTARGGQIPEMKIALGPDGRGTYTNPAPGGTLACATTIKAIGPVQISSAEVDFKKGAVQIGGAACLMRRHWTIKNLGFSRDRVYGSPGVRIRPTGDLVADDDLPVGPVTLQRVRATVSSDNKALQFTGRAKVLLDAGPSIPQGSSTEMHTSTHLAAVVDGLAVTVPMGAAEDIPTFDLANAKFDFTNAKVVPGQDSTIYGHALESCDAAPVALQPPQDADEAKSSFCLGLHINQGGRAPDDVAYGRVTLKQGSDGPFKIVALDVTLPKAGQLPLRVGVATFKVSSFGLHQKTDESDATYSFDDVFAKSPVMDSAQWPTERCHDIRLVADVTVDSVDWQGVSQPLSSQPRLGIGPTCTVFDLQGGLPLQFTSQSNVQVSSLVVALARGDNGQRLTYVRAGGSFTSGNVTLFFDALGYRSRLGENDRCVREIFEHDLPGRATSCMIWQPNVGMSATVTAVRNGPEIAKLVQGGLTALAGFVLHGLHF